MDQKTPLAMDQRTRTLLEAPVAPTLARLAIPNIIVMVVQTAVGLIEAYFVAQLGTDALAGVTLVVPVIMLTQMMSAGAMGGGMASAMARTLGAGRKADANALVWHVIALALSLGIATTALVLGGGRWLYNSAMGASGDTLAAALTYSDTLFAGAILIWVFNALGNIVRGTGNMNVPASVSLAGAAITVALSPALIFGWGPLPRLGVAGGAAAILLFYALGSIVLAWFVWSGRGVLTPAATPPRLRWPLMYEILRVGAIACIIAVTTNLTNGVATALVGADGPAAIAGYGIGARLEYLLIPLAYGFGGPLLAMVGTCIGAGRVDRAVQVAWTGGLVAGVLGEMIGLAAAIWPKAWLTIFSSDPLMIATGTHYLHIVGPVFGFFTGGMALYFASQGAGRLKWPLRAGLLRLTIAAGGGWLAFRIFGTTGIFVAIALALVTFGTVNAVAIYLGAWSDRRDSVPPKTGEQVGAGKRDAA